MSPTLGASPMSPEEVAHAIDTQMADIRDLLIERSEPDQEPLELDARFNLEQCIIDGAHRRDRLLSGEVDG